MEAVYYSETLGTLQTTHCYNLQDQAHRGNRRERLEYKHLLLIITGQPTR